MAWNSGFMHRYEKILKRHIPLELLGKSVHFLALLQLSKFPSQKMEIHREFNRNYA